MTQQVIYIDKEEFYCDGGDDFGHTTDYNTMVDGKAVCGYCNIKYVLRRDDE